MIGRRGAIGLIGAAFLGGRALSQDRSPRLVGHLSPRSAETDRVLEPFRKGMRAAGLADIRIEYRFADGRFDRFQEMASEIVAQNPQAIVTSGGPALVRAIRAASSTVPVVFTSGSDPVADGLVASFSRPGGNTTGMYVATTMIGPKRLELLREILPQARQIGFLMNTTNAAAQIQVVQMTSVAERAGIEMPIISASTPAEIDAAFEELVRRGVQALLMAADTFFQVRRDQIVALAARHGLPTMYEWPEFVRAGGLVSFSPSTDDVFLQVGNYVARIINGAFAGELPIFQTVRTEFLINAKTAKALGVEIPVLVLARADEVIE
jgi:putative tryptophan/tyrosine transport system substrate-binding protein